MPKAYVIAHIDVTDPEAYAAYMKASSDAMQAHGARILARGGRAETREGHGRARNVLVEFDSYDAARAFSMIWRSIRSPGNCVRTPPSSI